VIASESSMDHIHSTP